MLLLLLSLYSNSFSCEDRARGSTNTTERKKKNKREKDPFSRLNDIFGVVINSVLCLCAKVHFCACNPLYIFACVSLSQLNCARSV